MHCKSTETQNQASFRSRLWGSMVRYVLMYRVGRYA